jgi:hypothetical protein
MIERDALRHRVETAKIRSTPIHCNLPGQVVLPDLQLPEQSVTTLKNSARVSDGA